MMTSRLAIPAARPGTRLRARTDCDWVDADARLMIDRGVRADGLATPAERAFLMALPPILPGDAWEVRFLMGGFAGYAVVCPKCLHVHLWTTATNCCTNLGEDGLCEHRRYHTGSCWLWVGDLAAGTLTAGPSLHNTDPACGWHGWLRNGELVEA